MEKDCILVNTLKGTEYIRALAEDGSTVRIPVSELGKVMAQVMPVATSEKNGLMSTSDRNKYKTFSLQVGEEVNTGINNAGIIVVTALNITGSALVGVLSVNSTYVSVLSNASDSIVFSEAAGKICCFKKDANGTLFLKNNTHYGSPVSVAVL